MRRISVVFDLLVVVLFVVIGRRTHDHAAALQGFFKTFWPFGVGCLLASVAAQRTKKFRGPIRVGLFVGVLTTGIGMALRVLSGQGTAAAFIIVALAFLSALMIAWRYLARRFWPATGAGRAPQ